MSITFFAPPTFDHQNPLLPRLRRRALRDFPGPFFGYFRRAFWGGGVCALEFIFLELSFDRDFHPAIRALDPTFHLPIRDLQGFEIGCLLSVLIGKFHRAAPLPLLVLAQRAGVLVRVSIIDTVSTDPRSGIFLIF